MSSLYKRGGTWIIQYYDATGVKKKKTTGISVEADPRGDLARQVQRDFDTRKARRVALVEDAPASIRANLDKWLEARKLMNARYLSDRTATAGKIAAWFEAHGVLNLDQITPEIVEEYLQDRAESVGPKTMRGELDMLKGAAKIANRSRRVAPIVVDSWPEVGRITARRPETIGAYTAEEIERIIDDIGKRPHAAAWRLPILALAYLGCRWSELERARVGDCRLSESPPMIRLENHKTGKTVANQFRWVEVHPRLVAELRSRVQVLPPDSNLIEMPNQKQAYRVMKVTCKHLGIQYRRTHGLRHFWITTMLASGCPLPVVMSMCGHRNLSTTQGYMHLSDRHAGWVGKALPDGSKSGGQIGGQR